MNQEKIYDIEKRVAELKFLERDLIKERNITRLKSLDKAEQTEIVEDIIKSFFINIMKTERKSIIINSFPTKFSGRDDEEFISEIKVEVRFQPLETVAEYNELTITIYLNKGFEDEEVRKNEKRIMDKLLQIRKDVDELKESKKSLKQNN